MHISSWVRVYRVLCLCECYSCMLVSRLISLANRMASTTHTFTHTYAFAHRWAATPLSARAKQRGMQKTLKRNLFSVRGICAGALANMIVCTCGFSRRRRREIMCPTAAYVNNYRLVHIQTRIHTQSGTYTNKHTRTYSQVMFVYEKHIENSTR